MMCGFPGSYYCIKAFSDTELTQSLKRIARKQLMQGNSSPPLDENVIEAGVTIRPRPFPMTDRYRHDDCKSNGHRSAPRSMILHAALPRDVAANPMERSWLIVLERLLTHAAV
jgi:hypothetical protein